MSLKTYASKKLNSIINLHFAYHRIKVAIIDISTFEKTSQRDFIFFQIQSCLIFLKKYLQK